MKRNLLRILLNTFLLITFSIGSVLSVKAQMPGDLDLSFNGTGKKLDGFGNGGDRINGIAVQTDGKIVAAGQTFNGFIGYFVLVRYNSDGSLDTAFGENGKVEFRFGNTTNQISANAVVIQPDGKIVVVGEAELDFAVARLNSDGSFDTSFGTDGKILTDVGNSSQDRVFSVALQSDGKIIAGGSAFFPSAPSGSRSRYALARYNTDGTLDTTFDSDGLLIRNYSSSDSGALGVTVQPDGKIVACGSGSNIIRLFRYNSDGSNDNTFGSGGEVPVGLTNSSARAIAMQPDGKIVVAGTGRQTTIQNDFVVVRLNSNGAFDTTFDADGIVTTPVGANSSLAFAVGLQPDGRIIASGQSSNGTNSDFSAVRYNSDGSLDTTFNGSGKVITPVGISTDTVNAALIQTDGKIIAAGAAQMPDTLLDFALVRYNGDGTLDPTFDSDGIRTDNLNNNSNVSVGKFALQSDGKIVVAGGTAGILSTDFAVARYNSDGTPDTSFNGTGKVITDVQTRTDTANAVAIQSDGKIVAVGTTNTLTNPNSNIAVLRYNTDGSLDTSFDSDGIATILSYNYSIANDVVIQPDGKILIAGAVQVSSSVDSVLVRFNQNGSLDTTFNGSGIVIYNFGGNSDTLRAIKLQSDGKIVVVSQASPAGNSDFVTARFNPNGSLDASFDSDGIAVTPIGASTDLVQSLEIQSDGKIVVAGYALASGNQSDFALVRYNSNGSLDTTFNGSGIVTTPIGAGHDEAFAADVQGDGKIVVAGRTQNGTLYDYAIVRYNSDGTLDDSFSAKSNDSLYGNGGKVVVDIGSSDHGIGLVIDPNNKAVIVGQTDGLIGMLKIHGSFVPTAASAEISGRVVNDFGNGISHARVSVRNALTGEISTVTTNFFGYFRIGNLPVGDFYVVTVAHKRYAFEQDTQAFQLMKDISEVTFTGSGF